VRLESLLEDQRRATGEAEARTSEIEEARRRAEWKRETCTKDVWVNAQLIGRIPCDRAPF
jgi:hypothetical protein